MDAKWKPGSQHKVEAVVAYQAIEALKKKENRDSIDPESLVNAAKAKRHPLHTEFEWDDSVAGHEYRLTQARSIIRHIIIPAETSKTGRNVRMYEMERLPAQPGERRPKAVYKTTEDILRDPESRAALLARALRELMAFRNRFRGLQELAIVVRSIDEVIETLEV